jgi:hypothetical protein
MSAPPGGLGSIQSVPWSRASQRKELILLHPNPTEVGTLINPCYTVCTLINHRYPGPHPDRQQAMAGKLRSSWLCRAATPPHPFQCRCHHINRRRRQRRW